MVRFAPAAALLAVLALAACDDAPQASQGTAAPQQQAAAPAAAGPVESFPLDKVMGKADAPITIIEYSSLTCPHCATFHKETLPQVKKEWIDTGKAKMIYRDFPLDGLALGAALLPHCVSDERYFGLLDHLFATQQTWAASQNPAGELQKTVRLAGLDQAAFDACLKREDLIKAIQARAEAGQKKYDISSTPSFVINGEKVSGALPYAEFAKLLEKAQGR